MLRSFGRHIGVIGCRFIVKNAVSRPLVCSVNNLYIDSKHQSSLFHPRLHDGLILSTLPANQRCNFTTFTQQEEREDLDDLYRLISIEVKGHDKEVLRSYMTFLTGACKELEIKVGDIIEPPTHYWRKTLNKAVFASKRAKVQYEVRTHYRVVELQQLTGATASVFLEYIQRNLPEGCAMKVTKHKLHQFPESLTDAMAEHSENDLPSEDQRKIPEDEHLLTSQNPELSKPVHKDSN